jgi:hypothetical protein
MYRWASKVKRMDWDFIRLGYWWSWAMMSFVLYGRVGRRFKRAYCLHRTHCRENLKSHHLTPFSIFALCGLPRILPSMRKHCKLFHVILLILGFSFLLHNVCDGRCEYRRQWSRIIR